MVTPTSRRQVLRAVAALASLGAAPAHAKSTPLSLRRGVNTWPWFSLTRELPAPRTDYAWPPFQLDRPVPTPRDLAELHEIGLDFIRIPVDPGPFLAASRQERMLLLDQVLEAVRQALDSRLSVVVNLQANSATHYWTPARMLASTAAPAFSAYRDFAREIAGRLAGLDLAHLALEPVNEPPQACESATWNEVQNSLLTTIRTEVPGLTLVATGGCGSMIAGLDALDPAALFGLEPLLFTFHFYEPYLFTHQGAPWMSEPVYRSLNAVPWPASTGSLETTLAAVRVRMAQDAETPPAAKRAAYEETEKALKVYFEAQPGKPFIEQYLAVALAWGERHRIAPAHILMGEFGALRTDRRYVAAAAADRARYIRDVRESAETFGFPWTFWNLFDGMGMMDDTSHAFDPAIIAALGLTLPRH
ncbi:MAG: glycoside hydrolase family 5 protein [Beijerinckiaceae bacterium]